MGKHRLKYRTMKFPSSRQNGTLIPDQDSESDIQEFSLPKKRVVKPGKNPYVARRRPGCCRTCASIILSLILIASILCVVVLGWFSLRLKRDLDILKRRLAEVETADRSTSKECADRGNDLQKKVEALRGSTAGVITSDEKHFKTLLQKITVLNKTVENLKQRLKSPESASSIQTDIKLLKTAMADTGRQMTEISDKVTQLRRIAHLQNTNIKHLKIQMYNATVQLAKLSGQPTPRPVFNTATPPWLLRVPADNNDHEHPKVSLVEMEKMRKNISTHVKQDLVKIIAYVKKANRSLHNQVHELHVELSALTKSFAKQKDLIEQLLKKAQKGMNKDNVSIQLSHGNTEQKMNNLTNVIKTLTSLFDVHSKKFQELAIDVTSINNTMHQHVKKPVSCNCSLDNILKSIKTDEESIKALQSRLGEVQQSVERLSKKEPATTSSPLSTTLQNTLHPTSPEEKTSTKKLTGPSSVKHKLSTLEQTTSTPALDKKDLPTTSSPQHTTLKPTSKPTVKDKRTTKEDDDQLEDDTDLDLKKKETSDDLPPLSSELSDSF